MIQVLFEHFNTGYYNFFSWADTDNFDFFVYLHDTGFNTTGKVTTMEGGEIEVSAETVCVHSDTPGSPEIAKAIRESLRGVGVEVRHFAELMAEAMGIDVTGW